MPSDPKQTKKAFMNTLWTLDPETGVYLWQKPLHESLEHVEQSADYLPKEGELEELAPIIDITGDPQQPQSKEEWRISVALQSYGIPFYYQYSIEGGHSLRGGQVIDFYTPDTLPAWLIYAQGEYWHGRETERQLNISKAEQYFGGHAKVLEIWDYEHRTLDETLQVIKDRVL